MAEEGTCPELLALENCYSKLTMALPLDDIAPKLISQRVISISDKQEIMAHPTDSQRIGYFLDILSKQLTIGNTKEFNIFLKILKQNMKGGFLAGELEKELEKARSVTKKALEIDAVYQESGIPIEPITNMRFIHKLVVPKVSSCWESLAQRLQLEVSHVRMVSESNGGDNKKCCVNMIEDWISSDKGVEPKTWPVLLQAISNTPELSSSVAYSIKEELIKYLRTNY